MCKTAQRMEGRHDPLLFLIIVGSSTFVSIYFIITVNMTRLGPEAHAHQEILTNRRAYNLAFNMQTSRDISHISLRGQNKTVKESGTTQEHVRKPKYTKSGLEEAVYLINPDALCSIQRNTLRQVFLILVCSHPSHFSLRRVIRDTWLSKQKPAENVVVISLFVVGLANDTKEDIELKEEYSRYGDLLQYSYIDSYNNLTLKSLVGLTWADQYCSSVVDYIVKTDDDSYLNIPNLAKVIRTAKEDNFILGYECRGFKPVRNPNSKWYMSPDVIPGTQLPTFVAGWSYTIAQNILRPLLEVARNLTIMHLEDIFITGLCREKIGVKTIGHHGYVAHVNASDRKEVGDLVASHFINAHEHLAIWKMWNYITSNITAKAPGINSTSVALPRI